MRVVNIHKEPYDVYIDYGSKWENPFKGGTREEIITNYKEYIISKPNLLLDLHELKGKILGCYDSRCLVHGNVLIDLQENYFNSKFGINAK